MADKSSGIQEFSCAVDGWEDNVFHFWERYDSNVMLGRHNTTPEVEQFMQKVCAWVCLGDCTGWTWPLSATVLLPKTGRQWLVVNTCVHLMTCLWVH